MKATTPISFFCTFLTASFLPLGSTPAQVTTPFSDNFDSDTVGGTDPNFTTSSSYSSSLPGDNTWQIVSPGTDGSGNGFQSTITHNSSTIYNAAVVQAAITGEAFDLSSDFQMQAYSSSRRAVVGLGAFGNTAAIGQVGETGNNTAINVIWPYLQLSTTGSGAIGSVNLVNFRGGSGVNTGITVNPQVGANLTINTSDTYTLGLTGSYDGSGDLDLIFTAENDTLDTSASVSEVVSAAVMSADYNGNYFGLLDREDSSGTGPYQTETILQDNFDLSVTSVPEPSAAASILMGLGVLVSGRKLFAKKSGR